MVRRYLDPGVPYEGVYLGCGVAVFCCWYRGTDRNLRPNDGQWADGGPGHVDLTGSCDEEKKIFQIPPHEKEIKEILGGLRAESTCIAM